MLKTTQFFFVYTEKNKQTQFFQCIMKIKTKHAVRFFTYEEKYENLYRKEKPFKTLFLYIKI